MGIGIEEIRKVKMRREDKGRMMIVKGRLEGEKRNILAKLKGSEIWINKDQIFRKR